MAVSDWPTLSIGIPKDISDHAASLQNDFEEVHGTLQATNGTNIPRYLFNILHRSYSLLCAKLQSEGDEDGPYEHTLDSDVKFEERYTEPPKVSLTALDEDGTGVSKYTFLSTRDWESHNQTNYQHNSENANDLGEQEVEELSSAEFVRSTSENSEQSRAQNSEASSSCVVLRAQDLEPDFGQTTDLSHRDETLRKAMVDDMHKSTNFSVTLGVDSSVVTNQHDREYLLRHLENLPTIDRSLKIFDAINKDPAIVDASSFWRCLSRITRKRRLQIFVDCSQDCLQLQRAQRWITYLVCDLIRDIRNENPSAFADSEKVDYQSKILKHTTLQSCPEKDPSRPVHSSDQNKLVVQTPFKYSTVKHKMGDPNTVLAIVQSVVNVDPALDMSWVTAARFRGTDNVEITVSHREALNTLALDKGWKVRLRSHLQKGQDVFKVLMKDVPLASMDLSNKKQRKIATKRVETCNSGGSYTGNFVQTLNFAPRLQNKDVEKSSIIVDFRKPEPANQALAQGLLWDGGRYDCVRWFEGDLFEQCSKCQAFEYHEMECDGEMRCGKCAGSHSTVYCDQTFRKCVLCDGAHESTDSNCPSRLYQETKAKLDVPPKLPFRSPDMIKKVTLAMAMRTHEHEAQPKSPNPFPRRSLRQRAAARVDKVNHESALSDWFGGLEIPENSTQPTAPKRKAAEPLEFTAGNIQDDGSAKRMKREEDEEDHIQKYIRENGAIPWPPRRPERTVDNMEALSRRQRPRKSNIS